MVPPKERHSQAFPKGMRTVSGRHSGDARMAGAEGESPAWIAMGESLRQKDRAFFLPMHCMGESARPVV